MGIKLYLMSGIQAQITIITDLLYAFDHILFAGKGYIYWCSEVIVNGSFRTKLFAEFFLNIRGKKSL